MHPAKKAIKIIQSWKTVGQLGECRTKGNWSGGHSRRTSTAPFMGLFSVFLFFLAKDTLKTQMFESQLQVCSIADYYESPLSSISERPFVLWLSPSRLSTIGVDMPQTVAWLCLWQDGYSAQIKWLTSSESLLVCKHCSVLLSALAPPECPSGMEAAGRQGLFWIFNIQNNITASLVPGI